MVLIATPATTNGSFIKAQTRAFTVLHFGPDVLFRSVIIRVECTGALGQSQQFRGDVGHSPMKICTKTRATQDAYPTGMNHLKG